MSSNYIGADSFSPNLELMTDGDSPRAGIFRDPYERLLDNDVHLLGRATALETRATNLESRATALESRATALETWSEGRVEIFDDFLYVIYNSAATPPHIVSDSGPWRVRLTNSPLFESEAADPASGGVGALRMTWTGGSNVQAYVAKETATMRFIDARVRARARVKSIAAGMAAEIGLIDTASDTPGNNAGLAVSAHFDQSLSANWRLRTRGSSVAFVDTGVAVVANTWYVFDLGYNGSAYTLSINGAAAVTKAVGAQTPSTSNTGFLMARMAGNGSNQELAVDAIHLTSGVSRW